MPEVEVHGLRIAYERAGAGPPLVFLHGILSSSRAWTLQMELSDEFSAVAWDAPGAGGSADPPETFRMEDWADTLAAFMDELEIGPAHVCGLSWGGVLAQELYRRHPACVRSLILADSYAGWKGSLSAEECAERVRTSLEESTLPPAEVVRRWMPGLLSPAAPRELVDVVGAGLAEFHPTGFRAMARAVGDADTRSVLTAIEVPTLLLWGEADRRSPLDIAAQFRDAVPGARLVVIPQAGHASNLEQPARFNAEVREFCRAN